MCIPCTDICPKGKLEGATNFSQLPGCAGINKVVECKQFSKKHVECIFLANFKMSKLQESQDEHVEAAKIYGEAAI